MIDLSKLPAPAVVEELDYETLLAAIKADLLSLAPGAADVLDLESEPLAKVCELAAYRELLLRARVNDAARSCMLAYAGGTDLEHVAALFGVERLLVDPGDLSAVPPIEPTWESDTRLRERTQMALEGETVAGSRGAYEFHALSASGEVRDVSVESPVAGTVRITVLSTESDGVPSAALLATVSAYLSAEERRPLCDTVVVQAPTLLTYAIAATLKCYPGPSTGPVVAAAIAAANAYAAEHFALGESITLSGLYAALHQPGVQSVQLTQPAATIVVSKSQAARCTGVTLTAEIVSG